MTLLRKRKPKNQERWTLESMKMVCGLLKEFTLTEVAEKTGIDKKRIQNKATHQGWPIRDKAHE